MKTTGLPIDGDKKEFNKFNQIRRKMLYNDSFNNYLRKIGYEPYPDDNICPETESLIVYGYPDEINYPYVRSLTSIHDNDNGWFNLEVFNKNEQKQGVTLKELLPDKFLSETLNGRYSGKFIYVSMGSMGSVDLDLMNRLLNTLSKTDHKYIISKGPRHKEYEIKFPNQWGDRYLPQMALLPLVDLVITHGGNNSVTETFALGKPMIVLPLFADQFDNGQRLQETGYGIQLHPYHHTEKQLIHAIDQLLYDEQLKAKLQRASARIQSQDSHLKLALKIERMFGA